MKLVSPGGVVVDASETHAAVLLRDGWKHVEVPKPAEPKPTRRRTAKAAPKEV